MGYTIIDTPTFVSHKPPLINIDRNSFLKLFEQRERVLWRVHERTCDADVTDEPPDDFSDHVLIEVYVQRIHEGPQNRSMPKQITFQNFVSMLKESTKLPVLDLKLENGDGSPEGFQNRPMERQLSFESFAGLVKGLIKPPMSVPKGQYGVTSLEDSLNSPSNNKTCHICQQTVQTKHINTHLEGNTHKFAAELTTYIVNRASKHSTDPILATTLPNLSLEHYCAFCDIEMPAIDIEFHNLTFTHRSAVYKTELMQNLLAYYKGDELEPKRTSFMNKQTVDVESVTKNSNLKAEVVVEEKKKEITANDKTIEVAKDTHVKQTIERKELENGDEVKKMIAEYKSYKNKVEEEKAREEAAQKLIINEPNPKKKQEPKVVGSDKPKPQQPATTQAHARAKKNVVIDNLELTPNQNKGKCQTVTKTIQKPKAHEQSRRTRKKEKKALARAKANNRHMKAKALDDTTYCNTCQVAIPKGSYDVHVLKKKHMKRVVFESQNKTKNNLNDNINKSLAHEAPKPNNNDINNKPETEESPKRQMKEFKDVVTETDDLDLNSENSEKDFLEAVERLSDSIKGEQRSLTPSSDTDKESESSEDLQTIYERKSLLVHKTDSEFSRLLNTASNEVSKRIPLRALTEMLKTRLLSLLKEDRTYEEKELQKLLQENLVNSSTTDRIMSLFDFYKGESTRDFITFCRACKMVVEDCIVGWLRHSSSNSHKNSIGKINDGIGASDERIHTMKPMGNCKLYCFTCEEVVLDNPLSINTHLSKGKTN